MVIAKEELRTEVKEELLKPGVDNSKLIDIHKEVLATKILEEIFENVSLI